MAEHKRHTAIPGRRDVRTPLRPNIRKPREICGENQFRGASRSQSWRSAMTGTSGSLQPVPSVLSPNMTAVQNRSTSITEIRIIYVSTWHRCLSSKYAIIYNGDDRNAARRRSSMPTLTLTSHRPEADRYNPNPGRRYRQTKRSREAFEKVRGIFVLSESP